MLSILDPHGDVGMVFTLFGFVRSTVFSGERAEIGISVSRLNPMERSHRYSDHISHLNNFEKKVGKLHTSSQINCEFSLTYEKIVFSF